LGLFPAEEKPEINPPAGMAGSALKTLRPLFSMPLPPQPRYFVYKVLKGTLPIPVSIVNYFRERRRREAGPRPGSPFRGVVLFDAASQNKIEIRNSEASRSRRRITAAT